jgi:hypothetical protein
MDWSTYAQQFEQDGYFVVPQFVAPDRLQQLQERMDDIMLGKSVVPYAQLWMQLDSTSGKYADLDFQDTGFRGPSRAYRKIEGLEADPLFRALITQPALVSLCRMVYGENRSIGSFRTMFMNKPAQQGTWLPWHQDRWQQLDRDPLLTIWLALDPATEANGCVQLLPGSHRNGLLNPGHPSGFLTDELTAQHVTSEDVVHLTMNPGDMAVLHNHLLHASDVNRTQVSRRALSVCYLDCATQNLQDARQSFPELFRT